MFGNSAFAERAFGEQASTTAPPSSTVTGVSVTPASVTIDGGTNQQFSAVVQGTNSPSQSVTWTKVSGVGSINSAGLYSAPAGTTATQTAVVRATSVQDGTYFANATITISAVSASSTVTGVIVTPASITVSGDGIVDFDWVILGTNSPSQGATVSTSLGSIDANGIVTAPAAISTDQIGVVTVTSTQNPSFSGQATFTVLAVSTPGTNISGKFRIIRIK